MLGDSAGVSVVGGALVAPPAGQEEEPQLKVLRPAVGRVLFWTGRVSLD